MNYSRIDNKLPVAKEGIPFILIGCLITLILLFVPFLWPAITAAILTIFVACFFRDPERKTSAPEGAILTPADGRVCQIKKTDGKETPLGTEALRISVFMSIFNVHVNRMPAGGTIQDVRYRPGTFFSANLDKASEQNESNTIILESDLGCKMAVVQIAGLIARRIACWVENSDVVKRGQRFGLIRFGSRLDIYLPTHTEICVELGQRVKSGKTVIGNLKQR